MIQFNLLPDVKLDYISTKRTKQSVTLIATLVAGASLAVMVLLFIAVNFVQKTHLNNLSSDIDENTKKLQETPNLDKILTVQNQLNVIGDLHSKKPKVTRINTFLQQITPANASIADLNIDFLASTISISGAADSLATINKYVDTLKFTSYQYDEVKGAAFTNVVLTSFGINDEKTSYLISLNFDPIIFDSTKNITLDVPNIVTTRSNTDRPDALFQPLTTPAEGGSQ